MGSRFKYRLFTLILCFGFLFTPVHAQTNKDIVLTLKDTDPAYQEKSYFFGFHTYILKDSTGTLTLDDIRSSEFHSKFLLDTLRELKKWNLDIGSHIKAVWARVTIRSEVKDHLNWLISMSAGEIHFYTPIDSANYSHLLSGIGVVTDKRYFGKKYGQMSFFPLELAPGETKTFYFKLSNFALTIGNIPYAKFESSILSPEVYTAFDTRFRYTSSLFFGMMLAVAFYHLIIYFFNRKSVYLLFALVVFFRALGYILFNGIYAEFFSPQVENMSFHSMVNYGKEALSVLVFYLFSRQFLQLRRLFPVGDKIWAGLVVITFIAKIGIISIIGLSNDPVNSDLHSWALNFKIHRVLHILLAIITVTAPIVSFVKGNKQAWIYFVGFIFLSYSAVARMFLMYFPIKIPFPEPPGIDLVIAVLIFAFGIAWMIKRLEDEKKTAERSQMLLLAETSKMKELDAFKTRFYTNMTHEFRTPLTIILGMVDQIRIKPSEWYEKGLELIHRNGKKLLKLTNQMLYLSKLEARMLPVNKIQGNICLYLTYLVESFHSMAESKQIELSLDCLNSPIIMDYDPDKIQEIVSNLLSNAIKFTPEKGAVELNADQLEEDGKEMFQLTVRDTGRGIDSDILPHVFDRYFTVESPSGPNTEGTGLGLSLTKEVVRLLNGKISVESILGKGSSFTVLLPITREAEEKDWQQVQSTEGKMDSAIKRGKDNPAIAPEVKPSEKDPLMVLVVEDNHDVIDYLNALLKGSYRVETAENGKEGMEKALELIPDLVISDVMMPVMDGFEFCDKLKTDLRTSHIPVILLTAKADSESRLEGLSLGADA